MSALKSNVLSWWIGMITCSLVLLCSAPLSRADGVEVKKNEKVLPKKKKKKKKISKKIKKKGV